MNEAQLILKEYRRKKQKLLWKYIKSQGATPWEEVHKAREKVWKEAMKEMGRYGYKVRQEKREKIKEEGR